MKYQNNVCFQGAQSTVSNSGHSLGQRQINVFFAVWICRLFVAIFFLFLKIQEALNHQTTQLLYYLDVSQEEGKIQDTLQGPTERKKKSSNASRSSSPAPLPDGKCGNFLPPEESHRMLCCVHRRRTCGAEQEIGQIIERRMKAFDLSSRRLTSCQQKPGQEARNRLMMELIQKK